MTYKKALEINESKDGFDLRELPLDDLLEMIEEIPSWDYPLGTDSVDELARRTGIDIGAYFLGDKMLCEVDDDGLHGYDYSDLYADATEVLTNQFGQSQ